MSTLLDVYEKGKWETCVCLESPSFDYASDKDTISSIKQYKRVMFDEEYEGDMDWLPEGVFKIRYYGKRIKVPNNLPHTLRELIINSFSFNHPINNLPFIEILKISSKLFNQTPEHIPPTCKNVLIDSKSFNFPLDAFPDTIEYLDLQTFDIGNTSKVPANLQTLDIRKSLYTTKTIQAFQKKFPKINIMFIEREVTDWHTEHFRLTGHRPECWPIDVEIK